MARSLASLSDSTFCERNKKKKSMISSIIIIIILVSGAPAGIYYQSLPSSIQEGLTVF